MEAVKSTGTIVRDHLANERTFLAWIRTAFALIAVGLAFSKFTAGDTAILYGLLFVSLGIIFLMYSVIRYNNVKNGIDKGVLFINDQILYALVAVALILSFGSLLIMIYFR